MWELLQHLNFILKLNLQTKKPERSLVYRTLFLQTRHHHLHKNKAFTPSNFTHYLKKYLLSICYIQSIASDG